MASGIFTLKQQLQGLIQKAWTSVQVPTTTYAGSFNGSSQNLTVANNSAFLFGTGDFTVECFFNPTSITGAAANQGLVGMWGTGSQASWLLYYSGGTFIWYTSSTGSAQTATLTVTKAITVGTWYHVALVRYSGTTTIYINGTSAGSTSTVVNLYAATCALSIAINPAGGTPDYVNGSLSNLRIVKGVAVYTSNFAVPTSPLTNLTSTSLLTLQNATVVDNSSNAFTITNVGSVTTSANTTIFVNPSIATPAVEYLDVAGGGSGGAEAGGGAGGLLQGIVPITTGSPITVTIGGGGAPVTSGQNSVFGSITAIGGGRGAGGGVAGGTGGSGGGASSNYISLGGGSGGQGIVGQGNAGGYGSNAVFNTTGGGGGAGTIGIDAKSASAGAGGAGIASTINGTVTTYAGGGGGGAYTALAGIGGVGGGGTGGTGAGNGTNGSANTGGGGGGAWATGGTGGSGIAIISYSDTYNAPTTLTGTYTASTSGSGSLSLSGSGQYISYTSNAAFALPGDFTLEMWIYPLNWTASEIFPYVTYPGTDGGLMFGKNGSNFVIRAANVADQLTYGTLPTINAWTHIVAVRSGTTLSMYYNGTRVATTTNSYSFAQALLKIGSDGYGSDFPGYISNVRLVKGTAVYSPSSTTLTVPTAPLTAISGTSILLTTVSPDGYLDSSTNSFTPTLTGTPSWNQASPFATGLGYKNRVYTWTGSGTVTF